MDLKTFFTYGFALFICLSVFVNTEAQRIPNNEEVDLKTIINEIAGDYIGNRSNASLIIGIIDDTSEAIIPYGTVDKDTLLRPGDQTIYEIGSLTKTFTSVVALEMANEGLFSLDDPITNFLPDSISEKNELLKSITIYQLLTHQSQLPRKPFNLSLTIKDHEDPYAHYNLSDLYEYLEVFFIRNKKRKKKDSSFKYSNVGYGLLGHLLENISGKSLNELYFDYIIRPLGLKNTSLELNDRQLNRLSKPYLFNGGDAKNYNYASMYGSSGLYSSMEDQMEWMRINMQTPDLSLKSSIEKSHEVQLDTNIEGIQMAYGWHFINRGKRFPGVFVLNGGTGGYRSYIAFIKETKTGVIVLSNSANRVDEIGIEILEVLNQNKY